MIDFIVYAIAIAISAYLLPGIEVTGVVALLLTALVLGIVNALIKPLLILLTLPVNILTLGLFTLVINALLILLVAQIVPGFTVSGFWWALLFGVILSVISGFLLGMTGEKQAARM